MSGVLFQALSSCSLCHWKQETEIFNACRILFLDSFVFKVLFLCVMVFCYIWTGLLTVGTASHWLIIYSDTIVHYCLVWTFCSLQISFVGILAILSLVSPRIAYLQLSLIFNSWILFPCNPYYLFQTMFIIKRLIFFLLSLYWIVH